VELSGEKWEIGDFPSPFANGGAVQCFKVQQR